MKPALKTRSTAFGSTGLDSPPLFSVAGGITLDAALETAANLTECVIDIARSIGGRIKRSDGGAELWAAIHCLETVAAILDAAQSGMLELEHTAPDASLERAGAEQGGDKQ